MAITSAIMQMRRGLEADFDPDKMRPGEWAVSTDKKYVRMCFSVGVCVRMATYDAFEVDMAKIEEILEECQTIEEAVKLINSEVSDKLNAVIEYTNQAKQYRDEAKQFRDEAETFTPDGYTELQETVASNTAKIDTIIEKAELNIKNNASGEELHLTDSADSKAVSFGLYGKAEQKQYSGKNVVDFLGKSYKVGEFTQVINADGSLTITGTTTATYKKARAYNNVPLEPGDYYISGGSKETGKVYYQVEVTHADGTTNYIYNGKFTILDTDTRINLMVQTGNYTGVVNYTIYPMINKGTTQLPFEPYVGGIPSPNPDYPQDITVSGSDGSVEVVSENEDLTQSTNAIIPTPDGLAGIPVESGGNYTDENGQQWICDEIVKYADGSGKRIKRIGVIDSYNGESVTTDYMSTTGQLTTGAKVLYVLPEPIITDLTAEEIAEIEKLHTFYQITNISNDADCGMALTYITDSKLYIDNQLAIQKAQQEEALATMLLLMPEEVQASMIENDTNNLLNESEV